MFKKISIFLVIFTSVTSAYSYTSDVVSGDSVSGEIVDGISETQNVSGTTNNVAVQNGGKQNILSGGLSNATLLNDNGTQIVYSSGTANGTVINGTGAVQAVAGTAIDTNIINGLQQVQGGTLGGNTQIGLNGTQLIIGNFSYLDNSSKIAIDGGIQHIGLKNSNINVTMDITAQQAASIDFNWGKQYVYNGSSITGMKLGGGSNSEQKALQYILEDSSAIDTIIDNNSAQYIVDGTAMNSEIKTGGAQIVYENGVASGATISGGEQDVWGKLTGVTTIDSGKQFLLTGAEIDDGASIIINGGVQNIGAEKGAGGQLAADYPVAIDSVFAALIDMRGGTQNVNMGSSIDGMTVKGTDEDNKGTQEVRKGAAATNATVDAYGIQNVRQGAAVTNTTIKNNGKQYVDHGAAVSATTVENGGTQTVQGSATGTIIKAGGTQTVNKMIYSNGWLASANVYETIIDGGMQELQGGTTNLDGTIYNAGIAYNTTIQNGGVQNIGRTATANGTNITDGTQNVHGILKGLTVIGANGTQNLLVDYDIGSAEDDKIKIQGGVQNIGGASDIVSVSSSDAAKILFESGTQNIASGSSITSMKVTSEAGTSTQNVSGTAWFTDIGANGVQNVLTGGKAISTDLKSGAIQNVYGAAQNTSVANATQNIKSGGVIRGDKNIVQNYGVQNIESGASIGDNENYATISLNGTQNVFGTAAFSVLAGGVQNIKSGGVAEKTTVDDGAVQNVNAGGIAKNTIIKKNGVQYLYGLLGGETILAAGGMQNINSASSIFETAASGDKIIIDGGVQNIETTIAAADAGRIILKSGVQNIKASGSISGMTVTGANGYYGVQILSGTAENTLVDAYGIQYIRSGATISGNQNQVKAGGTINFETNSFNATAGSIMTFDGGRMRVMTADNRLTVDSNLSITGSGLIDINLRSGNNGADSDFITFKDISGNFIVDLKYDKSDTAALNLLSSIDIIRNSSSNLTLAEFAALNQGIDIGLYRWDIETNAGTVSVVRSEHASAFASNATNHSFAISNVIKKMSNSMYKRVGELQWLGAGDAFPIQNNGMWVRGIFKQSETSNKIVSDISLNGLEFGYDIQLNKSSQNNRFLVGLMGYFANGKAEFETINPLKDKNDLTAMGVGLYAIWLNKSGWFFDAAFREHFISQDATAYNYGSLTPITFDSNNTASSLNLDFGREFVYNTDKSGIGWFFTPHAQWNLALISGSDFETSNGDSGKIESNMSISASAELLTGPRWIFSNNSQLQVYGKIGYLNEFSHDLNVKIGTMTIERSFSGGQLEFGAGLNYKNAGGRTSVYLDFDHRSNSEYTEISGIVGLRMQF